MSPPHTDPSCLFHLLNNPLKVRGLIRLHTMISNPPPPLSYSSMQKSWLFVILFIKDSTAEYEAYFEAKNEVFVIVIIVSIFFTSVRIIFSVGTGMIRKILDITSKSTGGARRIWFRDHDGSWLNCRKCNRKWKTLPNGNIVRYTISAHLITVTATDNLVLLMILTILLLPLILIPLIFVIVIIYFLIQFYISVVPKTLSELKYWWMIDM